MSPETIGDVLKAMRDLKQLRHAGSYREGWEDAVDVWGQRLEAAMKTAPERVFARAGGRRFSEGMEVAPMTARWLVAVNAELGLGDES